MKKSEIRESGKRRRKKPRSAAQRSREEEFRAASDGWNTLTGIEWDAWDTSGSAFWCRSRKGKSRPLRGREYYIRVNCARARRKLAPLRVPPVHADFRPIQVGAFTITNGSGGIALKLGVTSGPDEHAEVLGSPPRNAGRRHNRDYRRLGPLPAPEGGESDLTEPYVKKYGVPPAGKRVFILIQHEADGEKVVLTQRDAIVPGKAGVAGLKE